jgi:hypothetical protein
MQRTQIFVLCMIAIFAVCLLVGYYIISKNEGFAASTIYDHPTRCFDCEVDAMRKFGKEYGWLGQPAKSFDAERHMIRMAGDVASAVDTHPIRYY